MNVKPFLILLIVGSVHAKAKHQGRPPQTSNPAGGVSDGHRLITRALWRIFDALMEKKNHEELYGRMKFVENTLNSAISTDTKLSTRIESMLVSRRRLFLSSYNSDHDNKKGELKIFERKMQENR